MNRLLLIAACLVFNVSAASSTPAAELQATTKAEIFENDGRLLTTLVDAVALIELEREPLLSRDDVIVSWQRAGGVSPQPFRIAIPAGCFVEQGGVFRVRGTGCGVTVTLDGSRISVADFAARVVPPEPIFPPEPIRLRIRLEVPLSSADTLELLGTLGGATVVVDVGAERGTAPPKRIDSLSGVSPTPF